MSDISKLTSLIYLLEDESPTIRSAVLKELGAWGPSLEGDLQNLQIDLAPEHLTLVRPFFDAPRQVWLRESWPGWMSYADPYEQLESALDLLGRFQLGEKYPSLLSRLLDDLAADYQSYYRRIDPIVLANFLFRFRDIKGAEDDYYNPLHSNLYYVLDQHVGLPISLALVYILVGRRLDLEIHGCNFPGHFLTRISYKNKLMLIDCYNRGQLVTEKELISLNPSAAQVIKTIIRATPSSRSIIARVLRNLIQAYETVGHQTNRRLMVDLYQELNDEENARPGHDAQETGSAPKFKPGDLVQHNQYGYRGVVVNYNPNCQADFDWYDSNPTQPDRDQPWYHVLVHQSNNITYAAESSLKIDDSGVPVNHPLIAYFFSRFEDGVYIRNNQPWPEDNL